MAKNKIKCVLYISLTIFYFSWTSSWKFFYSNKMTWKNKVEKFPRPTVNHKNKEMKMIIQLYCSVVILGEPCY